MFDFGQIINRHLGHNRRCNHIQAFVDPAATYGLNAQHPAVLGREYQFKTEHFCTRIVAGVIVGVDNHRTTGNSRGPAEFFGRTRHAHIQIKNLGNGGSQRALVVSSQLAAHVAGDNSTLFVGRPGQGNGGLLTRYRVSDFDGITGGEDMLSAGLQLVINQDMPPCAKGDARIGKKCGVGFNPDREDHQLGIDNSTTLKLSPDSA